MTKEIAVRTEYEIAKRSVDDVAAVIKSAAGAGGLTPQDLDKVKIPSGGGVAWEIPSLEGSKSEKELIGVIIYHQDARAYWAKSIDEGAGNAPPDCSSSDAITGIGTPGGSCETCPLAKYGSDKKGKGQACKATKIVYMITDPGALLPTAVALAPTSIKPMRQYIIRLAKYGLKTAQAITSITLTKEKNADGIAYAKAAPTMKEKLPPEIADKFVKYAEKFEQSLGRVQLQRDDVSHDEGV